MKWQARRVCAPDKMPVEIDRHGSAGHGRDSQGEGATAGATAATSRDATGTGHACAKERLTPGGGGTRDGQNIDKRDIDYAQAMDCSEDNEMAGAQATTAVVPSRTDSADRGQIPLGDGQAAGSSSRHFDYYSDRTADEAGPGAPPGLLRQRTDKGSRRGSSTTPGGDTGVESMARHDAPAKVASARHPLAAGTPGGGANVDIMNEGVRAPGCPRDPRPHDAAERARRQAKTRARQTAARRKPKH